LRLEREANAVKQAKQVKFALRLHGLQNFPRREVFDPDDKAFAEFPKMAGQTGIGLSRQCLKVGQGWRRQTPPIAELARHENVVGEVFGPTKRLTARPWMGNGWQSLIGERMRTITPSLALVGVVLALTTGAAAAVVGCNDKVANRGVTSACG